MPDQTITEPLRQMQHMTQPWQHAIRDPQKAQQAVLERNLAIYAQTRYGKEHHAPQINSLADYRQAFPVRSYEFYKPLIQQVMAGDTDLLLNEEVIGWAITRGTTKGENKFIPMTPTDLRMRVSAGRAVINYALQSKQFEIFQGVNLNLNFPSVVGSIRVGEKYLEYGYSSGIYTKHVTPLFTPSPARQRSMHWEEGRPYAIGRHVSSWHTPNARDKM